MSYSVNLLHTTPDGPCRGSRNETGLRSAEAARQWANSRAAEEGLRVDSYEVVDEEGEVVHYWERPGLDNEIKRLRQRP